METLRKICSVVTAFSFTVYFAGANVAPMMVKAEEKTKDYIICAQNEQQVETIEKEFESSGEINENGEELLQENHMTSVQMTESEAKELEEEMGVHFVEEDVVVEGSTHVQKKFHEKKVKKIKENKSENEWNIRMIRSDKSGKYIKKGKKDIKDRVKIAVLDSGVDIGNDIDLAGAISLVPGEEEVSPLFLDGTGHGNSVAGLIAAKDNDEGITGINPNALIYAIRVLDDSNSAPVSRVIEGIYMAIDLDVHIINMSFGVSEYSVALEQAIKDAEKAGILVIAAAGNTGEEGVQYPAAYDEVIAVGSVDKYGNVVEDSAKGSEIEIVAPGELVRSTGQFGDQLVSSGTSLAAPQVAGIASLIWEKDLSMSADFIRALLDESANQYGEANAYGNGLVDAEYALENYDTFKEKYVENNETSIIAENDREVLSFEETNCVEGSWSKDNHELLVSGHPNIKLGARFPDIHDDFKGMKANPWWHGYYETKEGVKNNYIAAYIYETRLANALNQGKNLDNVEVPSGLSLYSQISILYSIESISSDKKWINAFNKTIKDKKKDADEIDLVTPKMKRAFVWGMAVHNMADTFAHSVYVKDTNGFFHHLKHDIDQNADYYSTYLCADNEKKYKTRWIHAQECVRKSIARYDLSVKTEGTHEEYTPVKAATQYKLANLYTYMKNVTGNTAYADSYSGSSYIVK